MIKKKREAVSLREHGLQAIVSDYALDHWFCSTFRLDINNITHSVPPEFDPANWKKVTNMLERHISQV